jgi:hypothetical protein
LGSFADRLGIAEVLSGAIGWDGLGTPIHERGRVVNQAILMLAGGDESCADIGTLVSQDRLFGDVASDTTLYRTFTDTLTPLVLASARRVIAGIRAEVWHRTTAVGGGDPVDLDVDATLVEIHSENKHGAAPHFKRGFGFHPLFCFADATGDALPGMLRPGNAAACSIRWPLREAAGPMKPELGEGCGGTIQV